MTRRGISLEGAFDERCFDVVRDVAERAAWTALVRGEAERPASAGPYRDFATDFGAFDLERGAWREPLRTALLGGG